MRIRLALLAFALSGAMAVISSAGFEAGAQTPKVAIPKAISADPPGDAKFPARMDVLHNP